MCIYFCSQVEELLPVFLYRTATARANGRRWECESDTNWVGITAASPLAVLDDCTLSSAHSRFPSVHRHPAAGWAGKSLSGEFETRGHRGRGRLEMRLLRSVPQRGQPQALPLSPRGP